MYRSALEKIRAGIGASTEESSVPERNRGLVRPPTEPVQEEYSPLSFIEQAMQRLKAARTSFEPEPAPTPRRGRRAQMVQPEPETEELPEMTEEITEEGIRVTGNAVGYGLMKRPQARSGDGFLGLMDKHEGGGDYSALLGFSNRNEFSDVDVTQMTLAEIDQFARTRYAQWSKDWKAQRGHGNANVPSTPMGRYQFVNTTLQAQARKMGLDPQNTRFTPEIQDAMFEHYLNDRISRASTPEGKMQQLRTAWEGFKRVPDQRLLAVINEMGA
jgi:hypothetical protein